MIVLDPAKRIYVKEALKHPFFEDLNKDELTKYYPTSQGMHYGK